MMKITFKQIRTVAFVTGCVMLFAMCANGQTNPQRAAKYESPDWEDKIVPSSPLTVFEMARLILPDLKTNPEKSTEYIASDLKRIRLIGGVSETGMEIDTEGDEKHEISSPDYFWLKDGDRSLLVLVLTVDSIQSVIAVFKTTPAVTLLDAGTIAQDMHVSVEREKVYTIGPGHQAFTVVCWHDNSSESFDHFTFVSVVDQKLKAIAVPGAYTGFSTYSQARQRMCKQSTSPKFQFAPTQGNGYYDLIVSEWTIKACHRDNEEWSWKTGIVFQRTVKRTWRWDPRRKQYRMMAAAKR
jgi:hypothetical protein